MINIGTMKEGFRNVRELFNVSKEIDRIKICIVEDELKKR